MRILLAVLFLMIVRFADAGELAVTSDFLGGSAEIHEIDQEKKLIRLTPAVHQDRGWVVWWCVKVTGLQPGETVTLVVGDAPWATPDRAAVSSDFHHWSQTEPGVRDGKQITYQHRIESKETWFAWGPAYTPDDAQRLVEESAKEHSFAQAFELCQTRGGRSTPALRIEEPSADKTKRHGIWIQARQHAWESGSSWVCQGLTKWMLSDDPRAAALRKCSRITIVPIMDIDNTAIGAGGKEQRPQDHNRDWSDQPHWRAVSSAMKQIQEQDAKGEFDIFIDLHNPGASSKNPFFFLPAPELVSEMRSACHNDFLSAARLEMTGPLPFKGQTVESGKRYDRLWKVMSTNWISANTRDHVLALTLETAWNTPHSNPTGYQRVGQELGLAMERYLRTKPPLE